MKKFFLIVAIGLLCGFSGCGENSLSENMSAQDSTAESSEISTVTETNPETEIHSSLRESTKRAKHLTRNL